MRHKVRGLAILALACLVVSGCSKESDEVTLSIESSSVTADYQEIEKETESEEITQTEETQTEETQTEESVSLIMVGDILLHTPVEKSAVQEDGSISFEAIFANTKDDISVADIALVNQEVIIGGSELGISGYPTFNAPYEIGDALVDAGFDVICQATNHALDKGKTGLLNCINFWKTNYPDIGVVGIYDSEEDSQEIYITECNGIKVAILNYTYGTNGISLPSDMPYAVNMLTEEKVKADIAIAEQEADFTVVCPHWGTEYTLKQTSYQEYWNQIFYENGVDLVLGTHPHVIEPIEWYGDSDDRQMLVYYSLGNYVNWTSGSGTGVANRMVGGMAQVTLKRDEDGQVYIDEYGVEPLVTHVEDGINGVTVYRLDDYTQELAARNQIIYQDGTFSLEYCKKLCEDVWGGELVTYE